MAAEDTTRGNDRRTNELAELRFDDGSLIIYDRTNNEAWLQTDSPVSLVDVGEAGRGPVESTNSGE